MLSGVDMRNPTFPDSNAGRVSLTGKWKAWRKLTEEGGGGEGRGGGGGGYQKKRKEKGMGNECKIQATTPKMTQKHI